MQENRVIMHCPKCGKEVSVEEVPVDDKDVIARVGRCECGQNIECYTPKSGVKEGVYLIYII
jgi:transcription elongation factor Elf1